MIVIRLTQADRTLMLKTQSIMSFDSKARRNVVIIKG